MAKNSLKHYRGNGYLFTYLPLTERGSPVTEDFYTVKQTMHVPRKQKGKLHIFEHIRNNLKMFFLYIY
jgi:hypothetical protein